MRATVDRPGLDSQGRSPLIKIRRVRKGDLSKVRDVLEQAFSDFFERQLGTRPRQGIRARVTRLVERQLDVGGNPCVESL